MSIIVPAFNAAAYIHETIDSVLSQSFANWEMIIVDDHSSDDTWRVLSDYAAADCRVRIYRFEKNFGRPAGPRNFGVQHCTSEWVAFLDADDIWHSDKLRLQLEAAGKTSADIVCSTMEDFKGSHTGFNEEPANNGLQVLSAFSLFSKNRVPTSTVLMRRSAFLQLAGFDEAPEYKAVEDYDLWLRAACRGMKIVKLKDVLLKYRVLPNSISRAKFKQMKRVFCVVFQNLKAQRREWLLFYPFFVSSYMFQSAYSRLIKGTL
ncbi:glycosyltransferase [Vogesella sp. AC12]|uniref:glycosyltransferase family 2 protein n=1 Tax=Vogesella sp. AC12 TaxID=2950550 RepID=UPI0021090561|nr:glycosyltransferase [Vogesella sp. AC12]